MEKFLKIIKAHCLSIMLSLGFWNFWDTHEVLVAATRQKVGQVEDIFYNVAFLELGLF